MATRDSSSTSRRDQATVPADWDDQGTRSALTVLGMHRSGTSAAARVLSLLGADLPRHLMPGRADNEAGYWESQPLVDLNQEILAAVDSSWDDVKRLPESWFESAEAGRFRRRAIESLSEEYGESRLFVFKDPRICRLVPFWIAALAKSGCSPSFVITVRNPLEVASSLKARDGFSQPKGLLLWLRHMLDAERDTRGHPRAFVSYERLLEDWEREALGIADALQMAWPQLDDKTRAQVERFLEDARRHYRSSQEELDAHSAVVGWIKRAYVELDRACELHESPDTAVLDDLADTVDQADLAYGPVLGDLEIERRNVEQELAGKTKDLQGRQRDLHAAKKQLKTRRNEVKRATKKGEQLQQQRDDLRHRLEGATKQVAKTERQHAEMQEALADAQAELERLEGELESQQRDAEELATKLAAAEAEGKDLRNALEARETEAATMQADLAAAEDQRDRLRRQLRARDKAIATHEQAIGDLEEQLAAARRLGAQLDEKAQALVERDALLRVRNREVARLRKQVERAYRHARPAGFWRSASMLMSWIFRRPSKARLRFVRTYFALRRSDAFDRGFYLANNPYVATARTNPLMHYIEHGASAGLDPSPEFSTTGYIAEHPEIADSGANPLLHAIKAAGKSPAADRAVAEQKAEPEEQPASDTPDDDRDQDRDQDQPPVDPPSPGPVTVTDRDSAHARSKSAGPIVSGESSAQGSASPNGLAVKELVRDAVPTKANVLVLSTDEHSPPRLGDREVIRFPPLGPNGSPAAAGSTAAIASLETLRSKGATHLVIPPDVGEWITERQGFRRHVANRYPRAASGQGSATVHSLAPASDHRPWGWRFADILETYSMRFAETPSVLDWTGQQGVTLPGRFPNVSVFSPVVVGEELPYLPQSVDIVVLGQQRTPAMVAEARRVATAAVVTIEDARGSGARFKTEWIADAEGSMPSASIVIPTYNAADTLEVCLRSLSETIPSGLPFEVIVADDASTDHTEDVCSTWSNELDRLNLVKKDENSGFVDTCNAGGAAAEGDMLVFLNNDTIALPGWLSALVRTLRDTPDAGAVGGKLLYGDGRLQEAGGVIFSNAGGANFGRGATNPDAPLFDFARDVHYCSGALLATHAALFEELEGFDPSFGPGYYEDADYCLRVRNLGLRVLYQPDSAIVHLEGHTAGLDTEAGMKRHQVINRETFAERWASTLRSHPDPPGRWTDDTWHGLARVASPVHTA